MAWTLPFFLFALFPLTVRPESISTDTPVPPLQWINLTGLLSSPPPQLKNAVVGYDESSRTAIIFGGESAGGLPQSQTYLLNLETLTWSVPSPPENLQRTPPARSSSIGGGDFAASYRHGFIVIGGKGLEGKGLADVWEFDFLHEFWSEVNLTPGGPSPRWGASGGIDISTPFTTDPVLPGPNNTFYLTGGYNGTTVNSLTDVWRLNISGTLSPNLPTNSSGSWDKVTTGKPVPKFNQSGTVILDQIIVTGGCNSTTPGGACPQQDSYILDVQPPSEVSLSGCPAPRTGAVLVANKSKFISGFSSQVFLLLGLIDKTIWDDNGGLDRGEVAILNIDTGSWVRVLPSGDPGTSNKPQFPTPREGSAAFSYPLALVGHAGPRTASSDTLIFGGQDSSGNFLSEVWLLRAYNDSISSSDSTWSGFGDGHLRTGVDADGSGVRVTYISTCASKTSQTPHSSGPPTPTPSSSGFPQLDPNFFNTSVVHKILSPLSLVVFQFTFLLFRSTSPIYQGRDLLSPRVRYRYFAPILALSSYALGCAGIAISFTSIWANRSVMMLHLQTRHGIAGLVLFALLYGLFPVLLFTPAYYRCSRDGSEGETERVASLDATEKLGSLEEPSGSALLSIPDTSPPGSPRGRANSWGPSTMRRSHEDIDNDSLLSAGLHRGFEVLNRPSRIRKASALSYPPTDGYPDQHVTSRLQSDWLQRRRSLNAVGELDYAITQARREQLMSTPGTADKLVTSDGQHLGRPRLAYPSLPAIVFHLIIQLLLLGLSIITLTVLWSRASKAIFGVFLAWTLVFYAIMLFLAWHVRPEGSVLAALCSRFSSDYPDMPSSTPQISVHEPSSGPYIHQPPYQVATSPFDGSHSHGRPRSVETSDYDDDIDEDTRQRVIEEEMGRRDVSIVTVPKRKLWITNPS